MHGSGLVGRTDSTIWWAAGEELLDALKVLSHSDSSGFQTLADAILELDFAIAGVAAVDIERGVAFVSGKAVLMSGDSVFDGSTTGTWIEQRLPDANAFAVNAARSSVDHSTDLGAGVVRGGGFVFGEPELPDEPPASEPAAAEPTAARSTPSYRGDETIVVPAAVSIEATELLEDVPAEPEMTTESAAGVVVSVEFDDGRQVEVRSGLIVGRNPVGEALPAGFDSITVLDEFVSRRHWQLEVDGGECYVQDLGSAGGTIVEGGGETKTLEPDDRVELGPESRVLFADHWATVKVNQS